MRAFLLYIDDWLASKKIEMMDASEERGYLRLLMRAATEPDCGLPDDDAQLAVFSKLGAQWFKPTREREFRLADKTSGKKLRECFFEKDGRLYNERLLKEYQYQKDISEKRSKAAVKANAKRWHPDSDSDPIAITNGSQADPNDVCVSVSSFSEDLSKKDAPKKLKRFPPLEPPPNEFNYPARFGELWEAYPAKGRTKIIDTQRYYVEAVSPDPERIHAALIEPVLPGGKWAVSDNWARGFVCSLLEYIRNRRDLESPEPYKQGREPTAGNARLTAIEQSRKSLEDLDLSDVEKAY